MKIPRKRKQILYFGLDPSRYPSSDIVIHYPLIQIQPLPIEKIRQYFSTPHTHVLFTSRAAVTLFFRYTPTQDKSYIAIGAATAARLIECGVYPKWVADEPHGEGVIALLDRLHLGSILYPHSAQSRPLLLDYLKGKGTAFALYNTIPRVHTLPNLALFDYLVFTSPSTVKVFAEICSILPPWEKCRAIGPVTQNALNKLYNLTILHTRSTYPNEAENG